MSNSNAAHLGKPGHFVLVGSQQAWTRLVRFAQRVTRCRVMAEDAVQEAICKFLTSKYSTTRPEPEWRLILFGIIRNCALDELRHRRRFVDVGGLLEDASDDAAVQRDPLEELSIARAVAEVDRALLQLTPRQRCVFIETQVFERSRKEIAARLGIGPESVKTHLAAAVKKIRAGGRVGLRSPPTATATRYAYTGVPDAVIQPGA